MKYGEKSFSVAVGGNVSQDEWDRIFGKKKSKVDQYIDLAEELIRLRDAAERDWQAREELHLSAMEELFKTMTPREQIEVTAAAIRRSLRED